MKAEERCGKTTDADRRGKTHRDAEGRRTGSRKDKRGVETYIGGTERRYKETRKHALIRGKTTQRDADRRTDAGI